MPISITVQLDYTLDEPTDLLLQLEAAPIPEQQVETRRLDLPECEHMARVAAQDDIGHRIWLRADGRVIVNYEAAADIHREPVDWSSARRVPLHELPAPAVQYLFASRYCPADRFEPFVNSEFAGLNDGPLILAIRQWVQDNLRYVPGCSTSETTASDSFISRQGICRDYAHVVITLARAAGFPARMASVYAPGVDPPDFHAVAEVFLGGAWHLVDATGMATPDSIVKIGVGRDAADVAFLTAFGYARLNAQEVAVKWETASPSA